MTTRPLSVALKSYDGVAEAYAASWSAQDGDFYSSPAWLHVLGQAFPSFQLKVFEISHGGDVVAWLPVAKTRASRLVTLPLSPAVDFVVVHPGDHVAELEASVLAAAASFAGKFEFRTRSSGGTPDSKYFSSVYAGLLASGGKFRFATNAKRNIKKARAAGVTSETSDDYDLMWEFLNRTRKRQGSPMYPRSLLSALKRLHANGSPIELRFARTAGGRAISGIILFHDARKSTYAFGANSEDRELLATGGNALLFADTIERCYASGRDIFDFGITPKFNEGLIRFKDQFGATQSTATIYEVNARKGGLSREGAVTRLASAVLRNMPDGLYRGLSPQLFRRLM